MSIFELCQWLQNTAWGTGIRESTWVFPLIEGTHVLALALSVGTLMVMDLRLAGLIMRRAPVSAVSGQLKPWSTAGFGAWSPKSATRFCRSLAGSTGTPCAAPLPDDATKIAAVTSATSSAASRGRWRPNDRRIPRKALTLSKCR